MSSARDDILYNIRRSLGVTGREAPRLATVRERLGSREAGVIPARGQLDGAARIGVFKREAELVSATVSIVSSASDVPAEASSFLRDNNLPASLRMGADARLAAMDWGATALEVSHGPSIGADLNGVSFAFAGVAETGTLVMASGADNPTTLNFLPDNHIIVLDAADLETAMESVWPRLRARYGDGELPRVVNLITGPSRSADIEQTLLLGAHGPRRLHIVVIAPGVAI